MTFGLETELPLGETQLDAIHYLERRLDRSNPRYLNHVAADGVTVLVVPIPNGYAFTAVWKFRGDAQAMTCAGEDWFHVFSTFAGNLCKIFKVQGVPHRSLYP